MQLSWVENDIIYLRLRPILCIIFIRLLDAWSTSTGPSNKKMASATPDLGMEGLRAAYLRTQGLAVQSYLNDIERQYIGPSPAKWFSRIKLCRSPIGSGSAQCADVIRSLNSRRDYIASSRA